MKWLVRFVAVACVSATSCALHAQSEKPAGYALYRISSVSLLPENKGVSPNLVEALPAGGRIRASILFQPDCTEIVDWTWSFDRDIEFLEPDDLLNVTMTAGVSGDCNPARNPFAIAVGDGGFLSPNTIATLTADERLKLKGMTARSSPQRVYAKSRPGFISGAHTQGFAARRGNSYPELLWFSVHVFHASGRPGEIFDWEVAYLYRAVKNRTDADNVATVIDSPGGGNNPGDAPRPGDNVPTPAEPGSPTSVPPTAPPGPTVVTDAPRPPETDNPCLDPDVQACVERWLAQLVSILNRREPDRAPWSISEYGHLVNKNVRSVLPPDGWNTQYHRSKYCFVWLNYATAHTDPMFGGELPPLYSTCAGGVASTAGPAPNPGGGASSPGGSAANPGNSATGTGGGGTNTGSGTGGGGGIGDTVLVDPTPRPPTGPGGSRPPGDGHAGGRILLAEKHIVKAGASVVVPVRLLNPDGVANMNFEIHYDPSVAVIEGDILAGSLLGGGALFEANALEPGRIRIGIAQETGLAADGIVAYLPFKAVGSPGDRTPLTLLSLEVNDAAGAELPITLVHGEIIIVGEDGSVPCDCDGDGMVTVADAICALQMSVGLRPVDTALDANSDGEVTSSDARTILQKIP